MYVFYLISENVNEGIVLVHWLWYILNNSQTWGLVLGQQNLSFAKQLIEAKNNQMIEYNLVCSQTNTAQTFNRK